MSNEKTTYAELNLTKKSKRRQKNPKGTKGFTSETEQEICYAELNLRNATQSLQGNDKDYCCKGLLSPPEKLIAGVLGIICFVLLCIVLQRIITHSQDNSLVSHCAHCPPEGFTYSNNCYYTTNEKMTWNESVMACASHQSSLLYIESEEEMKVLASILPPTWVGIFRNNRQQPWMSINGSTSKLMIKENSAEERLKKLQVENITVLYYSYLTFLQRFAII
ncbi:NKG2-A/NKG2-B type II integral membrane protein-like [Sorex fumeus]|uniref:NKG2-A/NKG2-B type II integral membrane protein-like n=1 Tax=Sorex fumeus TaxID=62283 RepID=UPI0024AC94EE|nr:NKG2-A/NKG2-B type II integral membrane protein-like [Sorex fumeus]